MENTKDTSKESALRIGRYGVYWGAAVGEPCEDPLYADYLKDQEQDGEQWWSSAIKQSAWLVARII